MGRGGFGRGLRRRDAVAPRGGGAVDGGAGEAGRAGKGR